MAGTSRKRRSLAALQMQVDDEAVAPAIGRRIAKLALPALVVLAAEPLYVLFDIGVVGRLGALSMAGLAVGGLVLIGEPLTLRLVLASAAILGGIALVIRDRKRAAR